MFISIFCGPSPGSLLKGEPFPRTFLDQDRLVQVTRGGVNYGISILRRRFVVFLGVSLLLTLISTFKLSSIYEGALKSGKFSGLIFGNRFLRNDFGVFFSVFFTFFLYFFYGVYSGWTSCDSMMLLVLLSEFFYIIGYYIFFIGNRSKRRVSNIIPLFAVDAICTLFLFYALLPSGVPKTLLDIIMIGAAIFWKMGLLGADDVH